MKELLNRNPREALKFDNAVYRHLFDYHLTEEDMKQAELELGETEEIKADSLKKLKNALISGWKLDEMSFEELLLTFHACSDVITMYPNEQINGVIGLWDVGGLTASHVSRYANTSVIRTFLKTMQSTYPWRIKRLVLVNCNRTLRRLYNIFRYLVSKKIADRIIILGSDFNELHQYFNPRILPKQYGGCIETSECCFVQHILDNLPYIKYERSFGPKQES